MSTKFIKVVNRTELRVMILRNFGTIKEFTVRHNINYDTFTHYLSGAEHLKKLNCLIVQIMVNEGYDPYAPTPKAVLSEKQFNENELSRCIGMQSKEEEQEE